MKTRILLTMFAVWLAGCGMAPRETHASASSPSVQAAVIPVSAEDWPASFEASGTVRARTTGVIAARMTGYVREVRVNSGDRVASGQVLVVLDARDLDSSAQRAEAGLSEARAAVPEADQAIAAAKANLDLAESTFTRMQQLYSKKSIAPQEFDEASAKRKAATAAYDIAVAHRAQLDSRIQQAAQEVKSATITRSYSAAEFFGSPKRTLEPPFAFRRSGEPRRTSRAPPTHRSSGCRN